MNDEPETTEAEDERMSPQPHVKPKIEAIANLIKRDGQIHRGEEKGQKANADLAKLYQKIEKDFHGHKGAVKAIRTLVKGTTDNAYDFMRTFVGLAEHFDLFPADDLAGPGVTPPSGGGGGGNGDGQDKDEFEASESELAKQAGRPQHEPEVGEGAAKRKLPQGVSAIESARERLAGGTKPSDIADDKDGQAAA